MLILAQLLTAALAIIAAHAPHISASIVKTLWNVELALQSLIRIKKMLRRLK